MCSYVNGGEKCLLFGVTYFFCNIANGTWQFYQVYIPALILPHFAFVFLSQDYRSLSLLFQKGYLRRIKDLRLVLETSIFFRTHEVSHFPLLSWYNACFACLDAGLWMVRCTLTSVSLYRWWAAPYYLCMTVQGRQEYGWLILGGLSPCRRLSPWTTAPPG